MMPAEASTLLAGSVNVPLSGEDSTLVIVDMQYRFPASRKSWVLSAVERLIFHAVDKGWGVVVLEYGPDGSEDHVATYNKLMVHLSGHARMRVKRKRNDNGAPQILEACSEGGFDSKHFVVCGVNIGACVGATVRGLSISLPDSGIYVVKEACYDERTTAYEWSHFYKANNVHPVDLNFILLGRES